MESHVGAGGSQPFPSVPSVSNGLCAGKRVTKSRAWPDASDGIMYVFTASRPVITERAEETHI